MSNGRSTQVGWALPLKPASGSPAQWLASAGPAHERLQTESAKSAEDGHR